MPTQLTRVNLTLPDEVIRVLDRMGKVTGAGRATVIREWLIEGAPMFADMATAMELATKNNIDAFKVIGDSLGKLSEDAGQLSLEMKSKRRAGMRKRVK
jgi:predicted DNA-binding protein